MILLVSTTETLELITSAAVSTDYAASFADQTPTTFTPGSQQANIPTATTTTITAAPAISTQRQIKLLTVRNRGASDSQTVTVQKNIGGTLIRMTPDVLLKPGEVLQYLDGQGFSVLDPFAQRKASGSLALGVVSDVATSLLDGMTESLSLTAQGRLRVSSVQADNERAWQHTSDDPWQSLNNQWNLGNLYV